MALIYICILCGCSGGSTSTGSGTAVENAKVEAAMTLLEQRYPDGYRYVHTYISRITVLERTTGITGNVLNLHPDYMLVSSVEWLASAIVHDAAHVALGIGCTPAEEIQAIEVQMAALVAVGGSEHEIRYLAGQRGIHSC